MAIIRPSQLPPGASANPSGAIPIDQGTNVEKVTPKQVVDAGVPLASQVDAEAGNSNDDRMSSLRVKQAIAAQAATIEAVNARPTYTELASTAPGGGAALVVFESGDTVQDLFVSDPLKGAALVAKGGTTVAALLPVTPQEYGAIGDGIADDTTAFQEALNTGRDVQLIDGSIYNISSSLTTAVAGQRIYGKATLKASGTWTNREAILAIGHDDVEVSGLTFDGSDLSISAIDALGFGGTKIIGVKAVDTGWLAIRAGGVDELSRKSNIILKDITLDNNATTLSSDGWSGIRLESSLGAFVNNITASNQHAKAISFNKCVGCLLDGAFIPEAISGNAQAAIYFARGSENICTNANVVGWSAPLKFSRSEARSKVVNSHFDSSGFGGGGFALILFQGASYCIMENCTIISGTREGVMLETHPDQSGDPYALSDCIGNVITNCTIECSDSGCRYLTYAYADSANLPKLTRDNSFINCTFIGNGNTENLISLAAVSNTRYVNCSGSGATTRAVNISAASFTLENCEIDHAGTFPLIYATSTTSYEVNIIGGSYTYAAAPTTNSFADIRSSGKVTIRGVNAAGASGSTMSTIANASMLLVSGCDFRDSTNKTFFVNSSVVAGLVNGNGSSAAITYGATTGVTQGVNYVF